MKQAASVTREREIPISEFKARCLALVEDVRRDRRALILTRRGKPVARVVPAGPRPALPSPRGRWKGKVRIRGEIVRCDWSQEFAATREPEAR